MKVTIEFLVEIYFRNDLHFFDKYFSWGNIQPSRDFLDTLYIYIWVTSWEIYSQNFFFDETFFLPFHFENNRHVFFFSMWYLKISRYNFFKFGTREIFFFQQLTVKAVFNINSNPCTWNARKSTSFQNSYSTHFVVFFVITI